MRFCDGSRSLTCRCTISQLFFFPGRPCRDPNRSRPYQCPDQSHHTKTPVCQPARKTSGTVSFVNETTTHATLSEARRQIERFQPSHHHTTANNGHVVSVRGPELRSPASLSLLGPSFCPDDPRFHNDETVQLYRSCCTEPQDRQHCRPDQPADPAGDR